MTESRNSVPIRQVIPRIPKNAKGIVSIWLQGCEERGFRPVRLFYNRSMRESMIAHYSDHQWTSSGQKRAYYRFKRIIKSISGHNDGILDTNCTDKRKWEEAITSFERKWTVDGKMKPSFGDRINHLDQALKLKILSPISQ